jgi:hypothetical protein
MDDFWSDEEGDPSKTTLEQEPAPNIIGNPEVDELESDECEVK